MPHTARRTRLLALAFSALLCGSLSASTGGAASAVSPVDALAPAATNLATPVVASDTPARYVALGDSFTAAPGVPDGAGGSCARSTNNYPSVIARALTTTVTVDVSCSAADTTHMVRPQRAFGEVVPPQFEALTDDTDLVTIGIGGNDFGVFATTIFECRQVRPGRVKGAPCQASMETSKGTGDKLLNKIRRTEKRVMKVVKGIERRSPAARIMLVGYPQLAPSKGTCAKLPLAKGDYKYGVRINKALDSAVRRVAKKTGSDFVNVWKASRGHDVCSKDPWINGKDNTDQAIFFHPFANEQAAVAELILKKLS